MSISQFVKDVKSGKIDIEKNTKSILDEAKKINKDYNYFNTICEKEAFAKAEEIKKKSTGKLAGLPMSIKDNICVKGIDSTAGSKILEGYKPLFNATVIEKLEKEGAIIIGKTSQDEFGFGGFSINIGLDKKIPKNPLDKDRVTGGSSGGSAGYTAITKYHHVSIAESTGGSIVNPASFCGVIGLCPTYGLLSRYGLIDYANSLDKIGIMAKDIEDIEIVLNIIKGHDEKDSTSLNMELKDKSIKKIGIIKESLNVDEDIKKIMLDSVEKLGTPYEEISLPIVSEYGIAAYYLIAMSEASTNLAKFSGLRYGYEEKLEGDFNEYFSKVRNNAFGKEAKRRIILGTFARMAGFRDQYYLKAMKARTLMINEYKKAFKKYDILVSPTMPIIAPKFSEVKNLTPLQNYMMDILTVGPNLAGLPHITINAGFKDKMPVGIMFIGDHLSENKLIEICKNKIFKK
ncbi:aspartyl/glutamyl-tRNA amidotransferase subunit A [Candidatus Woesearchaeota archaeon]|nr:aspartyl/glutamyl-tRNA amidotransferase subunit A [Candidatus Woesearchaeota archaeon]